MDEGGSHVYLVLIAVVVAVLDQVSKYIVQSRMFEGQSIPIWENVFHLTYINNPGAAFGMLPYRTTFFILMSVVVSLGVLWYARTLSKEEKLTRVALGLVLGGALGNLIDRVRFGAVVDFFDFRIWPVFNIADVAICVAVALIFWDMLLRKEEKPVVDSLSAPNIKE